MSEEHESGSATDECPTDEELFAVVPTDITMPEGPDNYVPSTDRESPVGKPVIRGDPALTGQRPEEAIEFDPDDPESLELAAKTVKKFSENTAGGDDNVIILRCAAACEVLVRGEGSYKVAEERAGGEARSRSSVKYCR